MGQIPWFRLRFLQVEILKENKMETSTTHFSSRLPASRRALGERQGLSHISQLLELLFLKYGISTEDVDLVDTSQVQAACRSSVKGSAFEPLALKTAQLVTTASNDTSAAVNGQSTFAWYQTELTI